MDGFHYNISGEYAVELVEKNRRQRVGSISICNTNATLPCYVDLYIKKVDKGTFYLMKNVELPAGTTLEASNISFHSANDGFALYIKLTKSASETPTVDVILR